MSVGARNSLWGMKGVGVSRGGLRASCFGAPPADKAGAVFQAAADKLPTLQGVSVQRVSPPMWEHHVEQLSLPSRP